MSAVHGVAGFVARTCCSPVIWASCLLWVSSAVPAGEGREDRRAQDREASLRAMCARLRIGEGKSVADIGCGGGADSLVFASIVGPKGTVFAEEIGQARVKEVRDAAREKELGNVVPILGDSDDPRLPDGSSDLVYLHYVFHHLANPSGMLRNMWMDLEPGGFLVIVENGPYVTREWIPLEEREKRHQPIGETSIVRQVREAGFRFHDVIDDAWGVSRDFALAFEKPSGLEAPAGDPDLAPPIDPARVVELVPESEPGAHRPPRALVCALDGGRRVFPALAARLGGGSRIFDLALEEWATSKDEVPAAPDGVKVESLRAREGDFELPGGSEVDVVLFADAYHRLWTPAPALERIHAALAADGTVIVVDRAGPAGEDRRCAGHRRRISESLVKADMAEAGFDVAREAPSPGEGRFAIVFRKRAGEKWVRAASRKAPAGTGYLLEEES